MKNGNEILQALGLCKGNKKHADHIAAIYKFFEAELKWVQSATLEKTDYTFESNGVWSMDECRQWIFKSHEDEKDKVKMPCKLIKVETHRGGYSVAVPDNSTVLAAFCNLLNIKTDMNLAKQEKAKKLLHSFIFPAELLEVIRRAKPFCSDDTLRPAMNTMYLEIKKGIAQVIATDPHKMFISRKIKVNGPAGDFSYLMWIKDIKKLPETDSDFQFDVYKDSVSFLGITVDLATDLKYVDYQVVIPHYEKGVTFYREDMIAVTKRIMPMSNKSTMAVNYCFNGDIRVGAQDIDFSYEGDHRMRYLKKEIQDFVISFNGKWLITSLKAFDSEEVKMLTNGDAERGAIFTDGNDHVLVMPLQFNGEQAKGDPVYSEPLPCVIRQPKESTQQKRKFIKSFTPKKEKVVAAKVVKPKPERKVVVDPIPLPVVELPIPKTDKEKNKLNEHLDLINSCLGNGNVCVVLRDGMNLTFRYAKIESGKVNRGEKTEILSDDLAAFLIPHLENALSGYGKKISILSLK